jgi:hypothetical protein
VAKRKYLIIFLYCLKYSANIKANAWSVKRGKTLSISTIELSNNFSGEAKSNVKQYYKLEQTIIALQAAQNKNNSRTLHSEQRENNDIFLANLINKYKKKQCKFNSYYSTLKFFQYLEYGFRDNLSLFASFNAHHLSNQLTSSYAQGQKMLIEDMKLGIKDIINSSQLSSYAWLPSVGLWQNGDISLELKWAAGKTKVLKKYQKINNVEFGVNIPILTNPDNFIDNNLSFSLNYLNIRKFKQYGAMLMFEQFYSIYPTKCKAQSFNVRTKISAVKNLSSSKQDYSFALQLGYYYDIAPMASGGKIDQGVALSLWKEF